MDESNLIPANENPWYIMMTLHGEHEGEEIDWALAEKNRRHLECVDLFGGWMSLRGTGLPRRSGLKVKRQSGAMRKLRWFRRDWQMNVRSARCMMRRRSQRRKYIGPKKQSDPLQRFDVWLRLRKPMIFSLQDAAGAKASAAKPRHIMAKPALPEEEHFFFRREMHHAARAEPFLKTVYIYLFEAVSDFGHSIGRPAALLALLWALGAAFYGLIAGFNKGAGGGLFVFNDVQFFRVSAQVHVGGNGQISENAVV